MNETTAKASWFCASCDFEGEPQGVMKPRPSRRKTKICPACLEGSQVSELPNVTLHDMAKDYWRVERQGKYFGCIRERDGWFDAWHDGRRIGTGRTLNEAALSFKVIS